MLRLLDRTVDGLQPSLSPCAQSAAAEQNRFPVALTCWPSTLLAKPGEVPIAQTLRKPGPQEHQRLLPRQQGVFRRRQALDTDQLSHTFKPIVAFAESHVRVVADPRHPAARLLMVTQRKVRMIAYRQLR